jgi:hypothetical protein
MCEASRLHFVSLRQVVQCFQCVYGVESCSLILESLFI